MIKDATELLQRRPEVDLTGPDGNAFALMGMAKGWAKQMGLDWKEIHAQMMEGDYENLLKVLEKEFGDYVVFYR
jgi:hypothetical protein